MTGKIAGQPEGPFASGFVALVGRPNAGKSTLLNALVGEKVAIVSPTSQTTRHDIRGVLNLPGAQLVLVDTPGLHKPKDPMGELLNRKAKSALSDVDVVLHLIDASVETGRGDEFVALAVAEIAPRTPRLLVLTKTDLVDGGANAARKAAAARGFDAEPGKAGKAGAGKAGSGKAAQSASPGLYERVLPVSAVTGEGIDPLVKAIVERLPQGPRYYPEDMTTDQPVELQVAEAIREAVLARVREEVPHAVAVEIGQISKRPKGGITDVEAEIVVDRDSQKGIIIGQGGAMLTQIGSDARRRVEEILGGHVYLRLVVRTRRKWRQDESLLRRFGYDE